MKRAKSQNIQPNTKSWRLMTSQAQRYGNDVIGQSVAISDPA